MSGLLKRFFDNRHSRFSAVIPLFIVLLANVLADSSQAADEYVADKQAYLKSLTAVLSDYSQTVSEVRASLFFLQSEPPERCAEGFGRFKTVFSSLKLRLIRIGSAPGFEPVYRNSLDAITDYETATELYERTCIEEDFDRKNKLNIRAGELSNASVEKMGEVYAGFDRPGASGTQAVKEESTEVAEPVIQGYGKVEKTEEEYAVGRVAGEIAGPPGMQSGVGIAEDAEPAVEKERETAVTEAAPAPVPGVRALQVAPPEITEHETVIPRGAVTEIETPALTAPENTLPEYDQADTTAPEPEMPEQKTREENTYDDAGAQLDENGPGSGESAGKEAPGAQGEISKEERIAKLNEIIMSRQTSEGSPPATTPESAQSAAPSSEAGDLKQETTDPDTIVDDIKSWCMSRTYTEAGQEHCIASRSEARDMINKMTEDYPAGSRESDIVEKCKSDWKDGNTFNYDMVISCIQFFCTQERMDSCGSLKDRHLSNGN